MDNDSYYWKGLMVKTWTLGIDMESWYRRGLRVLTTPMVLNLKKGEMSNNTMLQLYTKVNMF